MSLCFSYLLLVVIWSVCWLGLPCVCVCVWADWASLCALFLNVNEKLIGSFISKLNALIGSNFTGEVHPFSDDLDSSDRQ